MTTLDIGPCSAQTFDLRTVDLLLTTTRSVRKRLDLERPVAREVIEQCLDLATYAPNAEDRQNWRWYVITDPERRKIVADYYWLSWIGHGTSNTGRRRSRWRDPRKNEQTHDSAAWFATHVAEVPALVIPCVAGRPVSDVEARALEQAWGVGSKEKVSPVRLVSDATFYGSIFPAIWSFQLALRSRGLASTITSMHLPFHKLVGEELGIPKNVTQVGLLPVAYLRGDLMGPGRRVPAGEVTIWNEWLRPTIDSSVRELLLARARAEKGADAIHQNGGPS